MLTELRIENFAIIQRLTLEFTPGLIAFTGETGAGKSILLDALEAIVGGRVDATAIRSGAERALVEATFELPETNRAAVNAVLEREDLLDDPHYITLGRELRREGRSVARVNGRSVPVALLRELGAFLVDIHGQSEHLSLLNVREHLGLLDRFAAVEREAAAYRQAYHSLVQVRRELASLRQLEKDAARRQEMLTFQVDEIESAHLRPGEEDEIRKERDRLANAESLADLARKSLSVLEDGGPEAPALSELLGKVVHSLSALSRIDPTQTELYQTAEGLAEQLSDISRELQLYLEGLEFNPRRLEQVEERVNLLVQLKRKYGGSLEAVLAFGAEARAQLEQIANATERIEALEKAESEGLQQLARLGIALSKARRAAAERLAKGVEGELVDLSMPGARFQVGMEVRPDPQGLPVGEGQRAAFDENGFDQVEFMIAPNPGEGFKPLVKIASGGETSRLMLALKNVLARADAIPTLVFDEIDQGIGGRVGTVVGEKLWTLARQHQVLCVTHLPQLAAFGDQHYNVRKLVEDGRTHTEVQKLEGDPRLDELALMLGGVSAANRSAAEEALRFARVRTREISGQPTPRG
ncbi:DNA repair protein RecN [Levilinea saccharolytica]|uniref:DNA repair protein RecN n=1 Tax=Levilinea saccharolytica TaxID=229921 RepID=A0A0P6Y9W2_9CHLR|nr:DNA repair protein RecN [Levilinea saccharolytica]KPL78595.1 hypothetical protein ADN01_14610 [Levilinea saccharolytica]GAP16215.1 DNA replication and repair protein RecN [Levilinea saccharolytica]